MKNFFGSKLNRPPYNIIKFALIYVCCIALSCSLAFGVCYSYFTDKSEGIGKAKSGILQIDYKNESDTISDELVIYATRTFNSESDERMIKSNDYSGDYYTYFMPGDTLTLKGKISNPTSTEDEGYVDSYVLIKLEIDIVHEDVSGKDVTETETVWYNLSGTKVVDSNRDNKYDTPASLIKAGETVNLANNSAQISYVLPTTMDNSYATKSVNITVTICAFQAEALDLITGYTDKAVQITNVLMGVVDL